MNAIWLAFRLFAELLPYDLYIYIYLYLNNISYERREQGYLLESLTLCSTLKWPFLTINATQEQKVCHASKKSAIRLPSDYLNNFPEKFPPHHFILAPVQ